MQADTDAIHARLRRIEGQVRGLQRMVDEDAYCIDILTQISAANRALQSVALELLDAHLEHCVRDAIDAGRAGGGREDRRGVGRDRPPREVVSVLDNIWASLREGFFMFWETLWPLILGFTLSGAVQAFAPRDQMERVMGDHRPRAVARASGLGMVSSSCSYAATAMGKSLFQKGADFVTAMIFMFASTNLVIELGIVLVRVDGLAVRGRGVRRRADHDRPARRHRLVGHQGRARRNGPDAGSQSGMVGGHDHDAMVGVSHERQEQLERTPWGIKLRSRGAWADAASYAVADVTMLRRELVIGYGIAGFLTVMVSDDTWNRVFLTGPRLLDHAGERHRRSVHRHHQLRVLHRQRPDGRRALARRHQLRGRDRVHLRRPHHDPVAAHLPQVLRRPAHRCGCSCGSGP